MSAVKAGNRYLEGQPCRRLRGRPREMAIRKTALPETAWILPRGDGSSGTPVFIGLRADENNGCAKDLNIFARMANEQLYWRMV